MQVRRLKVAGMGLEKPKLLCYVFILSLSDGESPYIHTPPCSTCNTQCVCLRFPLHGICLECVASVVCPPSYGGATLHTNACMGQARGMGGRGDGGKVDQGLIQGKE